MEPGSIRITDRLSASEAIKHLNEEDLRFLNSLIVERLRLIGQANNARQLAKFTAGDVVEFDHAGGTVRGVVLRLNQKSASILTSDNVRWKVSPVFLRLVRPHQGFDFPKP